VLFNLIWGLHQFSQWIYFPLLLIPSLIRYVIEPVRILEEKGWYSIMIRNERYASEFAVLNNLNNLKPRSESMSIEQDSNGQLETLRLEFNALAEKIYSAKSKGEKAKIRAERDRVEKEIFELRNKFGQW